MRIWLVILLLSSVSSFACGPYYPYGEDTRFNLLKAGHFDFKDLEQFNYSAYLFMAPSEPDITSAEKQNIELWQSRYEEEFKLQDVFDCVYLNRHHLAAKGPNQFEEFLKENDLKALSYLNFAKKCAPLNGFFHNDPWERNKNAPSPARTVLIDHALDQVKQLDEQLSLRYAFIAIRLAYYNREKDLVNSIYEDYFSCRTQAATILDYWGMYFKTQALPEGPERNFYAAQVFQFATDKRFMVHFKYDTHIPIEETLKLATTNEEKSAVWLLHSIHNPAPALEELKKTAELNPNSEAFDFLLIREVNKLEDWIYTPYYTNFSPSINSVKDYQLYKSYPTSLKHIKEDRLYAKQVLDFLQTTMRKQKTPPKRWRIAAAYLKQLTENTTGAISDLKTLIKEEEDQETKDMLLQIQTIAEISAQNGTPGIPKSIQQKLMTPDAKLDNSYLFAIARELEFKGNTNDAALLFSLVNKGHDWEDLIFWRTKSRHSTLWTDVYEDYFFYLDAQYSTSEVQELINSITAKDKGDQFTKWKSNHFSPDLPRLYDLLGTKYIREDKLKEALAAFKKVDPSLWKSDKYETYLDANPFYADFYNEHNKTPGDTITYNKLTITSTLIDYLEKAENPSTPDRAYYYFLAANCYYNMTQYGNSWMMKRYYWTNYLKPSRLKDDADYFQCKRAVSYYLKAKDVSKTKKFEALCIRMAAKCEVFGIKYELGLKDHDLDADGYHDRVYLQNQYYQELERDFPDDNEQLVNNCHSFETYFEAR